MGVYQKETTSHIKVIRFLHPPPHLSILYKGKQEALAQRHSSQTKYLEEGAGLVKDERVWPQESPMGQLKAAFGKWAGGSLCLLLIKKKKRCWENALYKC